jgi:hypothetical protein
MCVLIFICFLFCFAHRFETPLLTMWNLAFFLKGFWGGGFVAPFLATFYYFGFKVSLPQGC